MRVLDQAKDTSIPLLGGEFLGIRARTSTNFFEIRVPVKECLEAGAGQGGPTDARAEH